MKGKNIAEMGDGSGGSLLLAEGYPSSPNCGFNDAGEIEYIARKASESEER